MPGFYIASERVDRRAAFRARAAWVAGEVVAAVDAAIHDESSAIFGPEIGRRPWHCMERPSPAAGEASGGCEAVELRKGHVAEGEHENAAKAVDQNLLQFGTAESGEHGKQQAGD